jgi:hypothetical protein
MPALPSTGGPSRQPPARPAVADRRHVATRFRTALATGDYYALMGPGLRRTLRGAAADPSLTPEIGALRLALTHLLNEETDPSRLAAGVARLSSVALHLQAARLRAAASDEGSEFHNALLQELEAYERELAAQN